MSTEALHDSVTIAIPAKVTFRATEGRVSVKGPKGSVERVFPSDALLCELDSGNLTITLRIPPNRKRAKALLNTWEAHVKNLLVGVTDGFEARMKVVAAHFPMKVAVKDRQLQIENFLGEKHPRFAVLLEGVEAKVDGEFVVLSGIDIERVGQTSANIERATRIRNYDPRVFQDGIYSTQPAHPRRES
jgi:large subunit ribosomal protein L6